MELSNGLIVALEQGMRTACAIAVVVWSATARAEEPHGWVTIVPTACERFVPHGPESEVYWDRWLSLASCLQDATIASVTEVDELQPMVDGLSAALVPTMHFYRGALERGTPAVQLRAAYHVGLASVALMTRARSSIAVDPAIDRAAARRYRELHAKLEPLLVPAHEMAQMAFGVIDEAAAEDPAYLVDPVGRSMVRSARDHLRVLRPAPEAPPTVIADKSQPLHPRGERSQ